MGRTEENGGCHGWEMAWVRSDGDSRCVGRGRGSGPSVRTKWGTELGGRGKGGCAQN